MKTKAFAAVFMIIYTLQMSAQESSVKILLNEEERFRFEDARLIFINSSNSVYIGDSTAIDAYGSRNVVLGNKAGKNLKGGVNNTFLGFMAGYADTSGHSNVFIGVLTGWQNTSGRLNTFVGTNAGFDNTTGIRNTFIGLSAGGGNITGSYNTYVGRIAGRYNQEGERNVFIGDAAGGNEMGSDRLYISNSDTTAPLIYGEFDNELLRIHGTLDIKGIYQFPIVDGTSGQYMQTDGSGTLGWGDAGGDFSNGGEAGGADRSLGNTDDFALSFKTNDMTRLHLNNNGKIGIGTANPHGQFEVYKNSEENTTVGDFVVDTDNKKVYVGRLSTTPYNSSDFIVRNRFGFETFVVSAANYISLGNYNGAAEQMRVVFDGVTFGVGIGTTTPSAKLDIFNTTGYDQLRMRTSYTPSGPTDTNGHTGDIAWDDDYVYIKTSTGWKRAALTAW